MVLIGARVSTAVCKLLLRNSDARLMSKFVELKGDQLQPIRTPLVSSGVI